MNKEQLKNAITDILSKENIEGIILLALKDGSLSVLNLDNKDNEAIVKEYVKAVKSKCVERDFKLKNYSTADERTNCFYVYDLAEKPDSLQQMDITTGELEKLLPFNAKNTNLMRLLGLS